MQHCLKTAASQQRRGVALLARHLPWCTAAQLPFGTPAASPQLLRGFHGDAAHSEGLYEALGVERTASRQQIKEAFRQARAEPRTRLTECLTPLLEYALLHEAVRLRGSGFGHDFGCATFRGVVYAVWRMCLCTEVGVV